MSEVWGGQMAFNEPKNFRDFFPDNICAQKKKKSENLEQTAFLPPPNEHVWRHENTINNRAVCIKTRFCAKFVLFWNQGYVKFSLIIFTRKGNIFITYNPEIFTHFAKQLWKYCQTYII